MQKAKLVIGVDIIGYSSKTGLPYFAAVMLNEDQVVKRISRLSLIRLLKLVKKVRPDLLAVDNIFEFSHDENKLRKILAYLSMFTKIVQVTKIRGEDFKVTYLARKVGLKVPEGKLNPLLTAEIVARLARRNVGSIVSLLENETRIIVCRGRCVGSGGMSAKRFERNLNQLVLRKTNEIKKVLEEHGFDFDLFVRKGEGGLTSSLFIVYCSREKLHGIVKSEKGYDIKVIVKPVIKSTLEFIPFSDFEKRMREITLKNDKPIMVGVDPGIETGIAIMDLSGKVIYTGSFRNIGRNRIVRLLLEYGRPVLVACDVNQPPGFVKKLAASLNALLFFPQRTLTVDEKRNIVQSYIETVDPKVKIDTSHERDALAAVLKAYNHFEPKFARLEKLLKDNEVNVDSTLLDEAKVLIMKGATVKSAAGFIMEKITSKEKSAERPELSRAVKTTDYQKLEEELARKNKEISELKTRIALLQEELNEKDREIELLKRKIDDLRKEFYSEIARERVFSKLEARIENLKRENLKLQRAVSELESKLSLLKDLLLEVLEHDYERVIIIRDPSELKNLSKSLSNRVVMVNVVTESILNALIEANVRCVILRSTNLSPKFTRKFEDANIPVINLHELKTLKQVDEIALVSSAEISLLERKKLAEIKKRRLISSSERLRKIIEEYRRERIREAKISLF